jgi:hypothetical protein
MAATDCVPWAKGLWGLQVSATECDEQLVEANSPWELVTLLLALWLVNGAEVTTELTTEASGELLLENKSLKIAILCSGIEDGWVGPNSLDFTSEVLTLAGGKLKLLVAAEALECTDQSGGGCPSPLVWPVGLPWETEVELWETTSPFIGGATVGFVILQTAQGGGKFGWESECMGIIPISDECTTENAAIDLTLEGTTSLGTFSEEITLAFGDKLATCTNGGAEQGNVEGGNPITLTAGGELTASSETSTS